MEGLERAGEGELEEGGLSRSGIGVLMLLGVNQSEDLIDGSSDQELQHLPMAASSGDRE